ncbi:hypothetical protein KKC22_10315 [Myxococcota bacterium]|nr:hypothetical protein [Myxococcota bacterium]
MTDTTTTDTTTHTNHIDYQTDQYLVRKYVSRILTRFHRFRDNTRWTELRTGEVFGSPLMGLPGQIGHRCRVLWHGGLESEDVPPLRQMFQKMLDDQGHQSCPEGMIQRNLRALARELKLTDAELELLTFLLAIELYEPLKDLIGALDLAPSEKTLLIAAATGVSLDDVQNLLSDGSPLLEAELLVTNGGGHGGRPDVELTGQLARTITQPHAEPGDVLSWAISRDRHPALPLSAFDHLKPWHEVAWRCLKAADLQGRGLNVLLHGPGGAGKTALARCLARTAQLELCLHPQNGRPNRWSDTEFARAFAVLRRRGHGALLVDPGFISLGRKPGVGQLDLLDLMEHPGVQVLWTSPSLDEIHPNLLHRFDLVLALPEPPEPWTRPVWEDLLTPDERMKLGMGLP